MGKPRAVVIGTGAGGLTAAAYLAKHSDFDVVALERAQQFGGFINPFRRKKYEFDPGIHYVGQCRRGQQLWRALHGIDIDTEEMFAEMDPDGFDLYKFGDFEIRMCAGAERYRARLIEHFPAEVDGIDRFFEAINQLDGVAKLMNLKGFDLSTLTTIAKSVPLARWVRSTLSEFLAWCTDDPHLRDVLAAPCGDYGEPPSRGSALFGLAIVSHYLDGAFFPRGGSRTLRDGILDVATEHGAQFHRNTEVDEIVVRNGRAVAVRTTGGEEFAADVVISAVSPTLTFQRFLRGEYLGARFQKKVRELEPSPATLCLFFGLERDLRDHGLGNYNIWSYPDWDIDATYAPIYRGEMPEDPMLFLSPNSLKDPDGDLAPEGCTTLEVVTFAPWQDFAKWDGIKAMFRPDEYVERKQQTRDLIVESLHRRHPGVLGDVVIEEIATPVSNTHYVNSVEGGVYGPAATPDQSFLFRFRPNTPVENVFLAGSGVFGGGVTPCIQSGKVASLVASSWYKNRDVTPGGVRRIVGKVADWVR